MGRFLRRFVLILCAIAFAAVGGWGTPDHLVAACSGVAAFSAIVLAGTPV
jgi:hypothetical protein